MLSSLCHIRGALVVLIVGVAIITKITKNTKKYFYFFLIMYNYFYTKFINFFSVCIIYNDSTGARDFLITISLITPSSTITYFKRRIVEINKKCLLEKKNLSCLANVAFITVKVLLLAKSVVFLDRVEQTGTTVETF